MIFYEEKVQSKKLLLDCTLNKALETANFSTPTVFSRIFCGFDKVEMYVLRIDRYGISSATTLLWIIFFDYNY